MNGDIFSLIPDYADLPAPTLARLVTASQVLNSTLELDKLLQFIIDAAAELTNAEAASIMLYNDKTRTLHFEASSGSDPTTLSHFEVPLDSSLAGAIFRDGQALIINDAQNDPRLFKSVGEAVAKPTRSLLGVPMRIKDRTVGVLEAVNKHGGTGFDPMDECTLSALASQAAIAIENARLLRDLQQAHAELQQLDQAKSNFISIASHELRTPLHVILGYAEFLQGETSATGLEYLRLVRNSAMRLKTLIEDMVNLNYMDTGSVELEQKRLNLLHIVQAVVSETISHAKAQGLKFESTLSTEPLWVWADETKIHVAVFNVVSNAIQFTPAGGRVVISCERQSNEACVSVTDTGPGIPPQELGRIFERFYQIENHMTRRHGGLGLGLTIARGMVQLHSGRIWAESPIANNSGSRFTLALPLIDDQRSAPPNKK
jgi:K+-sensing histidine kinase KdpD